MTNTDEIKTEKSRIKFMKAALKCAETAALKGDVPIGAVVVFEGKIIARAGNQVEQKSDSTAHAEMIAIRKAVKKIGYKHLAGCSLYVTLEPCPMCAGASVLARFKEIVFGARDPKAGACKSLFQIAEDKRLNHSCEIVEGVMADECSEILKRFFSELRERNKAKKLLNKSASDQ